MAPARCKRPISVISLPLRPLVSAAMVCTLTMALSRARRWIKSTSATWSMTGFVSGMHTMVVTPPAAAALLAVFSVSRCSLPGLAREHLAVDQAGRQHVALAVDDCGAFRRIAPQMRAEVGDQAVAHEQAARLVAAARGIDQARIDEDGAPRRRGSLGGLTRRAWRGSTVRQVPGERLEHGHAHRDAHLDLLANSSSSSSSPPLHDDGRRAGIISSPVLALLGARWAPAA